MQTQRKPIGLSRSAALAFICLFGVPALLIQPQAAEQPQPGPEHKKLEVWVGEWIFETQGQPNPLFSASGSFKAKITGNMVLGGFFLERRGEGTNEEGLRVEWFDLTGYDPMKKSHFSYAFFSDSVSDFANLVISGSTWTFSGGDPIQVEGKVVGRFVNTLSSDGNTVSEVVQHSGDDGRTWHTTRTSTFKKVTK